MFRLLLLLVVILPVSSLASEIATPVSTAQLSAPAAFQLKKNNFEVGHLVSSINQGSHFTTIGIFRDLTSWFAIGARGMMPLQFTRQSQVYLGQASLRVNFLNNKNLIYSQLDLTQGYFNSDTTTTPFGMAGISAGYSRRLDNGFSLGATLGADYSPGRISFGRFNSSESIIYNRLAFLLGYNF